jgi:superfamily II DNA or RNA helicase
MTFVKNIEKIKELHKKGVELYEKTDVCLFKYATGVGKSKQAIDIIAKGVDTLFSDKPVWCLVYFETSHYQNWLDEFTKWGREDLLDYVVFSTYASLIRNLKKQSYNHFIFDEAHHAFSPKIYPIMTEYMKKGILLTATINFDQKVKLQFDLGNKDLKVGVMQYTLENAIKDQVLPNPDIWLVWSELDNNIRNQFIEISRGGKVKLNKMETIVCDYGNHFAYLKGKQPIKLKIRCTMYEKVRYYEEQVNYNRNIFFNLQEEWAKNKWIQSGLKRKKVIAEAKTETIRKLAKKLEDKRGVFFCIGIDQIKELTTEFGIHSKNSAKENERRLADFQNGTINHLYAGQKLVEGMNLEGIDFVVIVQLAKKDLTTIQKMGRGLRSTAPEIFIILLANTEDQNFWKANEKSIPTEFVKNYLDRP